MPFLILSIFRKKLKEILISPALFDLSYLFCEFRNVYLQGLFLKNCNFRNGKTNVRFYYGNRENEISYSRK